MLGDVSKSALYDSLKFNIKENDMYLTHSFVTIRKGSLDYLVFYVTEDYVEEQINLTQQLSPLLEELGRNFLDRGALIKPFKKDIEAVNKELRDIFSQEFTRDVIISLNDKLERPGLLILNADLKSFDPREHSWIYLSLQDFISNSGMVQLYNMKSFFDSLSDAVNSGEDLIGKAKSYVIKKKAISAHKMIEIKPGIFGISFDLKETINFLKQFKKN